uniref:T. congolense-specific, cell surface-expressed gene family n=1 Tax=Trypanosoma congolense (strain IL3000) TaxID=1068625 RepID=G0UM14_TRYCI|nr:hypothetical protein, unlikely [Trypanosoma congolense IL3000]
MNIHFRVISFSSLLVLHLMVPPSSPALLLLPFGSNKRLTPLQTKEKKLEKTRTEDMKQPMRDQGSRAKGRHETSYIKMKTMPSSIDSLPREKEKGAFQCALHRS